MKSLLLAALAAVSLGGCYSDYYVPPRPVYYGQPGAYAPNYYRAPAYRYGYTAPVRVYAPRPAPVYAPRPAYAPRYAPPPAPAYRYAPPRRYRW